MYTCQCQAGFTGPNCEININECQSLPCKHNAKCVDLINDYKCDCELGYTGKDCSILTDNCMIATDNTPGISLFKSKCQNGGKCINLVNNYKCDCDSTGYTGKNCEINVDDCVDNKCENNSTCIDGLKNYKCKCLAGFTGVYCDIDINECESMPCLNNATCWQNKPPFGPNNTQPYWCECPIGFTGKYCEIKINYCEQQPCGMNGYCIDLKTSYKCECKSGYTGKNCLQNINECELNITLCEHGSKCIDLDPNTNRYQYGYVCDCSTINYDESNNNSVKYAGQNCSIKLDMCLNENISRQCKNNSTCVSYLKLNSQHGNSEYSIIIDELQDFYCKCNQGYAGKYCELNTLIRLDSSYYLEQNLNMLLLKHGSNKNSLITSSRNENENEMSFIESLIDGSSGSESEYIDGFNFGEYVTLRFDFKLNLYHHKQYRSPLIYLKLVNNMTIELIINKNFIEIYLNNQLNEANLPFILSNYAEYKQSWHSIDIFIKYNFIEIIYSINNLKFNKKFYFKPVTKLNFDSLKEQTTSNNEKIDSNNNNKNNIQLQSFIIGKFFNPMYLVASNTNDYDGDESVFATNNNNFNMEACIRDLKLNDFYLFLNNSNIKYGCSK